MSVAEDSQQSRTSQQKFRPVPLQLPGVTRQLPPVEEQLSFPASPSRPAAQPMAPGPSPLRGPQPLFIGTRPLPDVDISSGSTGALPTTSPLPPATGQLPSLGKIGLREMEEALTGAFAVTRTTTALRQPVVIRGSGKKSPGTMRAPQGRRWVVSIAGTMVLLCIMALTLMAGLPIGSEAHQGFNPFRPIINWVQGGNSNLSLQAQLQATATAVTHTGQYDPGSGPAPGNGGYNQGYTPPAPGGGSGNHFAFGNCTYWASLLYHQMTGYWVPWLGDAWAWTGGAYSSGWVVSSQPIVPSIIVLQPGVQGAGYAGHVAVVIGINKDGSVLTSNMNWYQYGGGWDRVSYVTFHPGYGVSFVWF